MNNRTFQRNVNHSIRLKMHLNFYIQYWIIYLFSWRFWDRSIGILKVIYIPPNDSIIVNNVIALNIVYCIEFLQNKIKTIIIIISWYIWSESFEGSYVKYILYKFEAYLVAITFSLYPGIYILSHRLLLIHFIILILYKINIGILWRKDLSYLPFEIKIKLNLRLL